MKREERHRSKTLTFFSENIRNNEFGDVVRDWKWIFSYTARYKTQLILFVVLGVISTALALASSVTNKFMVDIVTGREVNRLWMVAVIWISSNVLSILLASLSMRYSGKISAQIRKDVQTDIFGQILRADWQKLHSFSNGEMLDRINGDAETIATNAVSWVPNIIIAIFNFVATFVVIWHYSKGMALIAVAAAPILFLVSRALMIRLRAYQRERRAQSSRLYGYETETFGRMETVKAMGLIDLFAQRFDRRQEDFRELVLKQNAFQVRRNAIMRGINMLVTGVAFAYALYLIWTGHITYGTMVLFLQQRSKLTQSMISIADIIPSFVNSSVSARRLLELLELPREQERAGGKGELPEGGLTLRLQNVHFAYESGGGEAICDGNLLAAPGETVALVGPSGRGKTTLLRLILGLVEPQSGSCVLIDKNGAEIEIGADSRRYFSYVPQGNALFSGTIGDNLRLMRPDATEEELRRALETADAWEFVSRLPEGMDAPVWENGKGLSEGQAQRVAIARALLRDAPVLLLDEATSALDTETEERVLRNLKAYLKDRTCIVTTHRPSVLAICDRVYRVTGGTVRSISGQESRDSEG